MLSAQIPIVSKLEFSPLLPDTTDEYKGSCPMASAWVANCFLRPGPSSFPRTATKLSRFCSISTHGLFGSSERRAEKTT